MAQQSWREWLFGAADAVAAPAAAAPGDVQASDLVPEAQSIRASAWSWLSFALLLVPWPHRQPASPDWDPSNGVGDWQARLAALRAADNDDGGPDDDDDDDDDENEGGGGSEGEAAAEELQATQEEIDLAHLPDSQLTEAQLIARHPWLAEEVTFSQGGGAHEDEAPTGS